MTSDQIILSILVVTLILAFAFWRIARHRPFRLPRLTFKRSSGKNKPINLGERLTENGKPTGRNTTLVFTHARWREAFLGGILWLDGHWQDEDLAKENNLRGIALKHWHFWGDADWSTHEKLMADSRRFHEQFVAALERIKGELEGQGWQITQQPNASTGLPGINSNWLGVYHLTRKKSRRLHR